MDMMTFISATGNLYTAFYLTILLYFININCYAATGIIVNRHDNTCSQLVVVTSPHNTATAAAAALWYTPLKATVQYR